MASRHDGTEPFIQHGRVFLRPPERDDVPLFVRWFGDWRTSRTLSMRAPFSASMEEGWFEHVTANQGKNAYHFTICRLEDDRAVGTVGLFDLSLEDGSAGLGISIGDPADRGQGLGTDALGAVLWFGFAQLRLERIWLDVFDVNAAARRVYERVGFVHEGTLRHAVYRDGVYRDVHRMAILVDEWRAGTADGPAR